ncbi:MAG: hypothetical protein B7Y62_05080 [Sphingomonadales bacterium 35-56-22]|jgi:uncharacterized protein (DUF885 family)|uniref:DUF885 domain-containing protein n=1 Tax=Sphingorhabdus sp. TaxID=1902408 RepID=UPI000BDCB563|nr:DUF885 domain-containing protein [Sphingorhabdus sp.]OYY15794.1 MAG: hypothetical protein B7Y62_05080 [Sphingomonadales bacterium 35-56-22]OYY97782.1 MAG: hypothetical protein B7Y38_05800 [Sphingomonadales bacterium 28-56-43]OYZ61338.1 MAG: hypothetical protein B7Y10_02600 [Sphingomonadales bacterium 24-56-14]OZA82738.1 MAG: hypothetical protein B7X66_07355 [Sphingomonadales bacterium 39-57-19]HQS12905.1 DUF885 domain-containing protein [Sphingorhabdus sp.]
MKHSPRILLLVSAALLTPFGAAHAQTVTAEASATESQRLAALFAADDEASLKRNPLNGMFRGDMRYADRFGDYVSDAYFDNERSAAQANLDGLKTIDRAKLNDTDKIAYDVYKQSQIDALKGLSKEIMDLTVVRPLNHFFGFHTFYPTFASGQGAAPFKTVQDYENNLKRHKEFIVLMDASIGRFRQGMASGVFETKMTISNVIDQLNTQLAQKTEESPYYGPVLKFPADFSDADKARLTAEYRDIIVNGLYPANARLRDFLRDSYLPLAREQVGLSAMKGGEGLYQYLIEQTTTLPLKADDVHNLGLSEVARIKSGMETIKNEVRFKGTLPEFFEHLRSDPKFKMSSRDALTQGYYDIGKKVDATISTQFKYLPKAPLEIKPYEEFREKYEAGGSYQQGTPDGSRPGTFYFNAYDLPSRTTPGMTTLYLHEGAPGHHFQISIAQENEKLPAFMRFGGNTAYVEGWALYSETLGYEMGLFKDPYQRFGTLSDEMLRAMRLVVDTGIHSKGWTREQAIDYMLANSDMGKTDATAEVERYIAIPSQALAYKIGALTILRLKDKAKKELGKKFDVREFHNQVLNTGALPLTVLEKKIDAWIAASK